MEKGKVGYVSGSKYLRELNGWIDIGHHIPQGSVAYRLLTQCTTTIQDYDELPTDIWFNKGLKGFSIVAEEAMLLKEWGQCLSLVWLDDDLRPAAQSRDYDAEDDEPLLEEIDGILPWPSKSRRK